MIHSLGWLDRIQRARREEKRHSNLDIAHTLKQDIAAEIALLTG